MKHPPHRRNFSTDSPLSRFLTYTLPALIADKLGVDRSVAFGMKKRLFGDLFEGIHGSRVFVDDPSITLHATDNVNTNDEPNPPHTRQRPQHPWYHMSPTQSVCLIILLLLFLLLIVFTMAVKKHRKKRLEIAQKYGKSMKKKASKKKQVHKSGEMENSLDVGIDNALITPMHTPTASVDKISVKGDKGKHVKA